MTLLYIVKTLHIRKKVKTVFACAFFENSRESQPLYDMNGPYNDMQYKINTCMFDHRKWFALDLIS